MKNSFVLSLIKKWSRVLLLALAVTQVSDSAHAALYVPGDVVTNLTFYASRAFTRPDGTAVPAGAQVKIKDFAGHVVFLLTMSFAGLWVVSRRLQFLLLK